MSERIWPTTDEVVATIMNELRPASERDWTEDFGHENGQYQNRCVHCREMFIGHKRRVICKLCAGVMQAISTGSHPTLNETTMHMLAFHSGQVDKSGVPYYRHPLRVMVRLGQNAPDIEKHAALLHDVIEDTAATAEILRDLGYSDEVMTLLDLLTRRQSETHRQYIYRLVGSGNAGAMKIKLADLYDNSMLSRLASADPEVRREVEQMIAERYKPAIRFIKEHLGKGADDVMEGELEAEVIAHE